ncbi:hypothetical protein BD770DRAFT_295508, partial [Pilaira anomala]
RRPGRVQGQVVRVWSTRVPNAGNRIEDARIISTATATWEVTKSQYYYRCCDSNPPGLQRDRQESITRETMFYRKKKNIVDIYNAVNIHGATIGQIAKDCQAMMHSDYIRYHGVYLLGSNPECDHIQIDESKFGKRKYNR